MSVAKNCAIYYCNGVFVFVPSSYYPDTGHVMMSVAVVIPEHQEGEVVGNACMACLSLCRVYHRLPDDWRPGAASFAARIAGERSQKTFEKKAALVEVSCDGGSIKLTPTLRYGGGGFMHKTDDSIVIADGNAELLGAMIRSSLRMNT